MEITKSEQQKEREMKKESKIGDLWGNIKCANLHVIGVPEGEERKKGIKNLFEVIMAESFLNLKKETDIQVQEAQRVLNKMNPNRPITRHIVKMAKDRHKKDSKSSKRKTKSQLQGNFSAETV